MLRARALTPYACVAFPPLPSSEPPTLQLRDEGKRQARLLELSGRGKSTDVRPLGVVSCQILGLGH